MKSRWFKLFSKSERPACPYNARPRLERLEARQLLSLTYHGGPLLVHPDVEMLYYGSQWLTDASLKEQASQINQFFQTITDSTYMDMLNEYGVGRGIFVDAVVSNSASPRSIDDAQIENVLAHAVGSSLLKGPDSNRIYFFIPAPGTEVTFTDAQGNLNTSGTEANEAHFVGYHSAVPATLRTATLYYAVIPYPGGVNVLETGFSIFQQITSAASHELAEGATDPDTVSGWIDDAQIQTNGGEVADLANGQDGMRLGYDVEYVWSNALGLPILAKPNNLLSVASGFTMSSEHYTSLILNNYQQLLGRTPSQSEINTWLRGFNSGMTDERVMATFLASPEYYQRAGDTDKAWVDSLYKTVLGRKGDVSGEATWINALASGQGRGSVAYGFTASAEHEQVLIQADYQLYLGRSASSAEVSVWLSKVQQGLSQEAMAAQFASSPESFFVKSNSVIDDWLTYAYQTILNRPPDPTGLNAWQQVLDQGLQ